MVKVKNLNNTSDKQPKGYNTWLEFWEGKTGKTANHCGATDCNVKGRSNLVGAHVKKVGAGDDSHYITPLCKGCNQRTDEVSIQPLFSHKPSSDSLRSKKRPEVERAPAFLHSFLFFMVFRRARLGILGFREFRIKLDFAVFIRF